MTLSNLASWALVSGPPSGRDGLSSLCFSLSGFRVTCWTGTVESSGNAGRFPQGASQKLNK